MYCAPPLPSVPGLQHHHDTRVLNAWRPTLPNIHMLRFTQESQHWEAWNTEQQSIASERMGLCILFAGVAAPQDFHANIFSLTSLLVVCGRSF